MRTLRSGDVASEHGRVQEVSAGVLSCWARSCRLVSLLLAIFVAAVVLPPLHGQNSIHFDSAKRVWKLSSGEMSYGLGKNENGGETHIFTPTLTNEFRFGYNYRHYAGLHENANNPTAASSLGLGNVPYTSNNGGLPFFSVSGLSNFGSPQFYATNEYENVYQILDNVTKVFGNPHH